MIKPVIYKISCMLVDVINETLARCDYRHCTDVCMEYLVDVNNTCPIVFHNEQYLSLWNALFRICAECGEQSHLMFLDK